MQERDAWLNYYQCGRVRNLIKRAVFSHFKCVTVNSLSSVLLQNHILRETNEQKNIEHYEWMRY